MLAAYGHQFTAPRILIILSYVFSLSPIPIYFISQTEMQNTSSAQLRSQKHHPVFGDFNSSLETAVIDYKSLFYCQKKFH